MKIFRFFVFLFILGLSSCGKQKPAEESKLPVFTLAWSEYPSWSIFGVAAEDGLIDGAEGKLGTMEEKWGVDIVLKEAGYGPCLQMYGSGLADAVCVTQLDAFNPAKTRQSVLVLPTSMSNGADALVTTKDITKLEQLEDVEVYGLEKSVSEYFFFRILELEGKRREDYSFINRDPQVAALGMQFKDEAVKAIVVWNPYLLETLKKRDDVHVLFDSTKMPKEIIDAVVVAQGSLDKPGGPQFAAALIEAFYAVNAKLAETSTRADALSKLGEKFAAGIESEDMETILEQTKIYSTPESGLALLNDKELSDILERSSDLAYGLEFFENRPKVAVGNKETEGDADLRLDSTYIKLFQTGPGGGK